ALGGTQPVGQYGQRGGGHLGRVGAQVVRRPGTYRVDARLAAHAARGGGVEVARRVHLRRRYVRPQRDVDHVVRVRQLVAGAQLGGVHVFGAPDDALGEQEADRQVEVVAGRPHGDGQRLARGTAGRTD